MIAQWLGKKKWALPEISEEILMRYGTYFTSCLLKGRSSIRGGWTTNFLLSYTHRRSGERFNKTLNGTKCPRNKSVIISEAFPRLGGKLFITQIYVMKAPEFLIEKWYIKQRNQKKIHKERQRFVTKSCLYVIPKKTRLRPNRKNPSLKNRLLSLLHAEGRPDLYLEKIGIISC